MFRINSKRTEKYGLNMSSPQVKLNNIGLQFSFEAKEQKRNKNRKRKKYNWFLLYKIL